MHASLEALFTSYRQNGRPEPLGEVFDRSSPQLLAVALHLCPHPADAEDALQATFVAAIDGASTWDAKKPLLPWLLGILTNQCRRIGERRARRREQELPDEPLLLDDGTPLAASERRDLIARLREHIERLPVEQRQVLLLQLEHGLAPAQAAEVLGVPPGTVRMRLHRGLQTLRGVLPASLVALLMAALPSRGVAAVRTAIVRHAAAGIVIAGGGLLMKKIVAAVAAVLVLLALGYSVLAPASSHSPPRSQSPAVLQHAAPPGDRVIGDEEPAPKETPSARTAAESAPATGSLVVRASFDSGKPMANQPFRYSVEEGETSPIAPTLLTDAMGTARIDGLAPGAWRIELSGWASERNGVHSATVTAGSVAVVEVVQPAKHDRPLTVRGRVVHATGQPAPGATIVCAGAFALGEAPCGVAAADGSFTVVLPLTGTLGVGARLAGHAPSALQAFEPRDSVTLVLGGTEAIVHGTVVDHEGRAVAGATVELAPRDWWVPERVADDLAKPPAPRVATTDTAGLCTLSELVAAPLRVRIRAPGFAAFEAAVETTSGTTLHACWQLARGGEVHGKVVDEQGQPIRAYANQLCPRAGRECASDGTFRFANAPADAAEIEIWAPGFVTRTVAAAALRASAEPIVLRRWPRYVLRLVDERGEPLRRWLVSLAPNYHPEATATDERGVAEVSANTFDAPRLLVSPPRACAEEGRAVRPLPWPANVRPGVACDVVVPDDFAPTASVRGALVAPDGSAARSAHVELRTPDGLRLAMLNVDAGAFRFAGVPAGDWQLWIRRGSCYAFDPPVAIATLAAGEERDVGAIHAPADGSLHVAVRTANGRRPVGLFFSLVDARGESTHVPIDGDCHELPVGRYRWRVIVEDACWRAGELEVRAGERRELDVVLPPGALQPLRVELPPDAGVADGDVEWSVHAADGTVAYHARTPMRLLAIAHVGLSPGTWRVEIATADGRRFTGAFDVPSLAPSSVPIRVELKATR